MANLFNQASVQSFSRRTASVSPPLPGTQLNNRMDELDGLFQQEHEEGIKDPQMFRYCMMREISTQTEKPHRGRKPNPPSFLTGTKKTEEKDKFWLRAFRSAMKRDFPGFKSDLPLSDRAFWRDYVSKAGEPGKAHRFQSYSRSYKDYLFSSREFAERFGQWLETEGVRELRRKYNPEAKPEMYEMMWEYAKNVLAVYHQTITMAKNE